MKNKINLIGYIGLLFVIGLLIIGCEFRDNDNCPKNGKCVVWFRGTGLDNPPIIDNSKTDRCSDKECNTYKVSASDGYYTSVNCRKCGN